MAVVKVHAHLASLSVITSHDHDKHSKAHHNSMHITTYHNAVFELHAKVVHTRFLNSLNYTTKSFRRKRKRQLAASYWPFVGQSAQHRVAVLSLKAELGQHRLG